MTELTVFPASNFCLKQYFQIRKKIVKFKCIQKIQEIYYIVHLVRDRRFETSVAITRVKLPMFPTRRTRYFVQPPQTMQMRFRRRSYKFLNRLTDYQF